MTRFERPEVERRNEIWRAFTERERREAFALMGRAWVEAYLRGEDHPFTVRTTLTARGDAVACAKVRHMVTADACTTAAVGR